MQLDALDGNGLVSCRNDLQQRGGPSLPQWCQDRNKQSPYAEDIYVTTIGAWDAASPDIHAREPWNGQMDDVRIYNYARTPEQIAADAAQGPEAGLIAWYKFSGNAEDSSGNGRDGVVNGAVLAADQYGIADEAYSFNGVDSAIAFPAVNIASLAASGYSVSLWAYVNTVSATQTFVYQDNTSGYPSTNEVYLHMWAGGEAQVRWAGDGGAGVWDGEVSSLQPLTAGRWYHLAYTASLVDGLRLYVDGVLQGTDALSVFPQTAYRLVAGRLREATWRTLNGNSTTSASTTALSAGEISELAERRNQPPQVTLCAPLPVDEGSPFVCCGAVADEDLATCTVSVNYGDGFAWYPVTVDGEGQFVLEHTYCDDRPFPYTVTVTATDSAGLVGAGQTLVTVQNIAPLAEIVAVTPPNAAFILPGDVIVFGGRFTDPGWCETRAFMWDYDDGASATGLFARHAFAQPGTYDVLFVVDDGGP